MLPSCNIGYSVSENGFVLFHKGNRRICLVGSTMPASVSEGQALHTIQFFPFAGSTGGLVAVMSETSNVWAPYLVEVVVRDGRMLPLLDTNFFPCRGRQFQWHNGHLIVPLDGGTYGGQFVAGWKKVDHQVPNESLLVQYLYGGIDDEAVKAAAAKIEEEQSELERLQAELAQVKGGLQRAEQEVNRLSLDLESETSEICRINLERDHDREMDAAWAPLKNLIIRVGLFCGDDVEPGNEARRRLYSLLRSLAEIIELSQGGYFGFRSGSLKVLDNLQRKIPFLRDLVGRIMEYQKGY